MSSRWILAAVYSPLLVASGCIDYEIVGKAHEEIVVDTGVPQDSPADSPIDTAVPEDSPPQDSEPPVEETAEPERCPEERPFLVFSVDVGAGFLAMGESLGDGTFAPPQVIDPGLDERAASFAVGDFTGDGCLDIAARGETSKHLFVLVRDGAGWTFSDLGAFDVHLEGGGDTNGDGALDLIGITDDYRRAEVWLGNGDGTFAEAPNALNLGAVYSGYSVKASMHIADVSGDGVPDLALADYDSMAEDSSRVWLAIGRGDGTFVNPAEIGSVPTAANAIDLADLDQDGHPELLAGLDDDGDAGVLYWGTGVAGGFASTTRLIDLNPTGSGITNSPGAGRVGAYDWNGDGYPEPLVSYQENPYSVGFNTLYLLNGLDDGSLDSVRKLSELGNAATVNFAVPL